MNASSGERTAPETLDERQARDRLRTLAGALREGQRPPLRRAADALLTADPEVLRRPEGLVLELPRRTLRLRHRKSFKPTGTGTGAIDLFVLQDERGGPLLARLIRKSIRRTAVEVGNVLWLAEALFYLDIAPRLACDGIAIPEVHGCSVDEGAVTLVMSFMPPPQPPHSVLVQPSVAAQAIGRLGAFSHRHGLHEASWLERVRPRFTPDAFVALEGLIGACVAEPVARDRVLGLFEACLGDTQLQHRLDEKGLRSLCHGDLHPRNLLALDDGVVAFIDWSHVGVGTIGHDLGRFMLPDFLYAPAWEPYERFGPAIEMMAAEVTAAARSVVPGLPHETVRDAIDRSLIQQAAMLGVTRRNALEKMLSGGGPQFRARLRSVLDYAAAAAAKLIARHD